MRFIHTLGDLANHPVDMNGFHPQPESTRIDRGGRRSVQSSTIHSTYYYYLVFQQHNNSS